MRRRTRQLFTAVACLGMVVGITSCGSSSGQKKESRNTTTGASSLTTGSTTSAAFSPLVSDFGGQIQAWVKVSPPTYATGVGIPYLGRDQMGMVPHVGYWISKDASRGFQIIDRNGAGKGDFLWGGSFEWNPSGKAGAFNADYTGKSRDALLALQGKAGAFNADYTGLAFVDENGVVGSGAPLLTQMVGAPADAVPMSSLEFETWITDNALLVSAGMENYLAVIDKSVLRLTPIAFSHRNWAFFDRLGKGIFVSATGVKRLHVSTGEITDVGSINPAPSTDYIAAHVSWSPVALEFAIQTQDQGMQLCRVTDAVSCRTVVLPENYLAEGAIWSPDGKVLAINGHPPFEQTDYTFHPLFLLEGSLVAKRMPYRCKGHCYVDGFIKH